MELKLSQGRENLSEGRDSGEAFALGVQKGDKIETIMPLTTCKDFLNDVIYAEKFKTSMKIYGFEAEYRGIFKRKKYVPLVVSILNNSKNNWIEYKRRVKLLDRNYKNILYYINSVEDALKIPRSKVRKIDSNLYVFRISRIWTKYMYMISLYTTMIRYAIYTDVPLSYKEFKKELIEDNELSFAHNEYYKKLCSLIYYGIGPYEAYLPRENDIHNSGFQRLKL